MKPTPTHVVQALSVFVRYVAPDTPTRAFYQDVLKLPMVRSHGVHPADLFWGGEAVIFETVETVGKTPDPDADPAHASCVPVFRTPDLDGLLARLAVAGVLPVERQRRGASDEAFVLDPSGRLVGFRERAATSQTEQDTKARRRAVRGETWNPGCREMPDDIQEFGWAIRRVADLPAMALFHEDVLGLVRLPDDQGRHCYDLGDNVVLELLAGGRRLPDATHRADNSDVLLLRVCDTPALRTAFVAHGGRVVTERLPIHWGDLAFLADPEGCVIGVEQAIHPGAYAPGKVVLPENLEAERRWRERLAAER